MYDSDQKGFITGDDFRNILSDLQFVKSDALAN